MKRFATLLAAAAVFGFIVAFLAHGLTADTGRYFGTVCFRTVHPPGFDPWTGEPFGAAITPSGFDCHSDVPMGTVIQTETPSILAGRRAIPLLVGFVAGFVPAIAVMLLVDRMSATPRPRSEQTSSSP
jgi:hypothetical protein